MSKNRSNIYGSLSLFPRQAKLKYKPKKFKNSSVKCYAKCCYNARWVYYKWILLYHRDCLKNLRTRDRSSLEIVIGHQYQAYKSTSRSRGTHFSITKHLAITRINIFTVLFLWIDKIWESWRYNSVNALLKNLSEQPIKTSDLIQNATLHVAPPHGGHHYISTYHSLWFTVFPFMQLSISSTISLYHPHPSYLTSL